MAPTFARAVRFSLVVLAVTSCAAVRSQPAPAEPNGAPLLYRVSSPSVPDAGLTLFGTIHLAHPDYRWDRSVDDALAAATELLVEIDLDAKTNAELQARVAASGRLPPGQRLRALVSPETFALSERAAVALGLDPKALDGLTPWMATLMFAALQMTRPPADGGVARSMNDGLDRRLLALARERRLPIRSLETVDEQLDAFTSGDAALHEANLRAAAELVLSGKDPAAGILAAYEAGDVVALAAQLEAEDGTVTEAARQQKRRMFGDRNARMFAKLRDALRPGVEGLAAVGAGHLVGNDGLVALFRGAGFQVQRAAPQGPGAAFVATWVAVDASADGFTATFPEAPVRKPASGPGDNGVVSYSNLQLSRALTVESFPSAVPAAQLPAMFGSIVSAVAHGDAVTAQPEATFQGARAFRATVRRTGPAGTLQVVLLAGKRRVLAIQCFEATPPPPGQPFCERFEQGLSLVDL